MVNGRNSVGNCLIYTTEPRTVLFVAKFGQDLTELGFSAFFFEISRRRARKMEANNGLFNGKGMVNDENNIGK